MSKAKPIDLGLKHVDELFMDDAERAELKLPRIHDIPLDQIDDFPDHPFKVREDEDMEQLVQSVRERGIITPIHKAFLNIKRWNGGNQVFKIAYCQTRLCSL